MGQETARIEKRESETSEAQGPDIGAKFHLAHGQALELEYRYLFVGRPGKARAMFYWNRANMGNYRESLALKSSARCACMPSAK